MTQQHQVHGAKLRYAWLRRGLALQTIIDGVVVIGELKRRTSHGVSGPGLKLLVVAAFAALALMSYLASMGWSRGFQSMRVAVAFAIANSFALGIYGALGLYGSVVVAVALACVVPLAYAFLVVLNRGVHPTP